MIVETLIIGLVLALLFAEATDLAPGGLIVPGYLALFVSAPKHLAVVLAAAAIVFAAGKAASRAFILFGRRRFALFVLAGAVLMQAAVLAAPGWLRGGTGLHVVGFVIPGILANSLERQKPAPTLAALAIVTAATSLVARLLAWL